MTTGSRITTLSRNDGWFDGHGTADLRAWLRFWKDDAHSEGRAEDLSAQEPERFGGMGRKDHIAMIEAEIAAREAKRRGRPRAEISDAQRAELIVLVERAARSGAQAVEDRRDLHRGIREARESGASVRVIAEVVGFSPARVQALAHRTVED
jgi:hypothetical protein